MSIRDDADTAPEPALETGALAAEGGADSGRWLSTEEQQAWRSYLRASRLLDDALDDDLQEHGLQLTEYEILAMLSEAEGRHMRMSSLAEQVVQSRSRLTHTAGRLEQRGLVLRRPARHDGRGVDLWLTSRGVDLLREVAPIHVESVRRHLIDPLGSQRFAELGAAMATIRRHVLGLDPDNSDTVR
ncbi:MAG: MarR family transcriptional regulator [Mobilicoccus sp.]|nr:MarR family transcriptional regulator [Mobilicoccus sp.]